MAVAIILCSEGFQQPWRPSEFRRGSGLVLAVESDRSALCGEESFATERTACTNAQDLQGPCTGCLESGGQGEMRRTVDLARGAGRSLMVEVSAPRWDGDSIRQHC